MKKFPRKTIKVLILANLFLGAHVLTAQNIEKSYVNMPEGLNPTLSKQNRLELLEYYKAGQSDSIMNRYGKQAHLLSIDSLNQLLVVRNTPISTFEMKVFNLNNNSPMIGIIRTACGTICQSSIEFYDTAWNQVPLKFTMPKAIDWVNKDSLAAKNVDRQWVENLMENSFISLSFVADRKQIIASNNSLKFLSEADRKIISPILENETHFYELEGGTWVRKL